MPYDPRVHAVTAFEKLNERQRAATEHGAGPLLIIAGAGTGKTNTLAHRVAHLVLHGASPQRILLLTFTRRAALEMTRRARRIVGEVLSDVRLPWSGTFHSVANRVLRRHAGRLGLDPGFSVLDRGDAADLIDLARHELGLSKTEKRFPRKDTCLAIYSHRVNTGAALGDTLQTVYPWCAQWEQELTRLFRSYTDRKLASHVLDYDDLLLYWDAIMEDASLATEIGGLFDHILVDEYQDTNALQARILKALRPDGAGITVVGDDAQAIYSFRAASVENILGFPAQYTPAAAVIALEQNYRSTQCVLDAANALIAGGSRQYRKTLQARRGAGMRPRYVTVLDDQGQAHYVVTRVLEAREHGVPLRRQAVLFRNSHHSDPLELELVRRNIPYVKYGGLKFLEAAHVKDLLSVLRWADNPKNRVAAFRALQLQAGIGPGTAARIFERFEAQGHSWSALATSSPEFDSLMGGLGRPEEPWPGQVQRAREWFEPQLERIYEAAQVRAGDLQQLERIAQQFGIARAVSYRACARPAAGDRRPGRPAAARRGLPDPVDDPFRQGPGMGGGSRPERSGRQFSFRVLDRSPGADRRGAAAAVCGDDARENRFAPDRADEVLRNAAIQDGRPPRVRRQKPIHDPRGHGLFGAGHLAGKPRRRGARFDVGRATGRRGVPAARHVVLGLLIPSGRG
jgi:DNA helicase-2/ATP-dependent DNA helicase PcrA